MLDVIHVHGDFAAHAAKVRVRRKVELREPRDSRTDTQSIVVSGNRTGQGSDELGAFGSRSDQGHFTFQDVEQLWKLVQMEPAEQRADARDARVAGAGPHGAGSCLGIVPHGPDLVQLEGSCRPCRRATADRGPARAR